MIFTRRKKANTWIYKYWRRNCHLNTEGHRLIAEALSHVIEEARDESKYFPLYHILCGIAYSPRSVTADQKENQSCRKDSALYAFSFPLFLCF